MNRPLPFVVAALLHSLAAGQQVATSFASDTHGPAGGAAYFDLGVGSLGGITVTGIQVGLTSPEGTSGTIQVWKCAGTRVGNEQNPLAWTLVASGPIVACCPDEGASVDIAPFTLPFGSYGIALHAIGVEIALTSANAVATAVGGLSVPTDVVLTAGEAANTLFASPPIASRTASCKVSFGLGTSLITPAVTAVYGCGCGQCPASFHETFAAGTSVDLVGSSWTMIPTATGYVVIPGIATFVVPTGIALNLALGDDDEVTVALSSPFVHTCSATAHSQLTVCSNGFVSLTGGNGTDWDCFDGKLLNAPVTAWWAWHDFDPTNAGSGPVLFEEIGTTAYVTWDAVKDFSGGGTSTVQFQFDLATGQVSVVFVSASTLGNAFVTGYSPGGPSLDFGRSDVSAASLTLCCVEQSAMHLDSLYRPVFGQPLQFLTTHMPGTPLLFVGYSVVKAFPGVPVPGSPGCELYHAWNGPIDWYFATPPTQATVSAFPALATIALPIGLTFYAQAVAFPVPSAPGGWVWSNGVELTVGSY